MKKYYALLLPLLFNYLTSLGQNKFSEYSFQAGVNLNTAYKANVAPDNTFAGLSIGGNIKFDLQKKFALKAGLFYDQNGLTYHSLVFENSAGTGLLKADLQYRLHYLNLPVMAEYTGGSKIKYYFDAGIFLGYLLHLTATIKPVDPTQPETKSAADQHGFNFGVVLAAGVKIPLTSRLKLDLGVKNQTGLTNTYPDSGIKLNSFSMLAGVCFAMK